jgi:hypothetical protein
LTECERCGTSGNAEEGGWFLSDIDDDEWFCGDDCAWEAINQYVIDEVDADSADQVVEYLKEKYALSDLSNHRRLDRAISDAVDELFPQPD